MIVWIWITLGISNLNADDETVRFAEAVNILKASQRKEEDLMRAVRFISQSKQIQNKPNETPPRRLIPYNNEQFKSTDTATDAEPGIAENEIVYPDAEPKPKASKKSLSKKVAPKTEKPAHKGSPKPIHKKTDPTSGV